jgi:hypothetical protein
MVIIANSMLCDSYNMLLLLMADYKTSQTSDFSCLDGSAPVNFPCDGTCAKLILTGTGGLFLSVFLDISTTHLVLYLLFCLVLVHLQAYGRLHQCMESGI